MWLENGRPKVCDKYPDKLCQVVLEAVGKVSKDIARTDAVRMEKVGGQKRYKADGIPDELTARLLREWQPQKCRTVEVTREINTAMGSLNVT